MLHIYICRKYKHRPNILFLVILKYNKNRKRIFKNQIEKQLVGLWITKLAGDPQSYFPSGLESGDIKRGWVGLLRGGRRGGKRGCSKGKETGKE